MFQLISTVRHHSSQRRSIQVSNKSNNNYYTITKYLLF